jgi:hypothetical protein
MLELALNSIRLCVGVDNIQHQHANDFMRNRHTNSMYSLGTIISNVHGYLFHIYRLADTTETALELLRKRRKLVLEGIIQNQLVVFGKRISIILIIGDQYSEVNTPAPELIDDE